MFELQIENKKGEVIHSTRNFTLLSLDRTMTSGSFLVKLGEDAIDISNLYFTMRGVLYYVQKGERIKIFTGFYFGLEKFRGFTQILFSSLSSVLEKKDIENINFTGNFSEFLTHLDIHHIVSNQNNKTVSYESKNVSILNAIEEVALSSGNEWIISNDGIINIGEIISKGTTNECSIKSAGNFSLEYQYSAENFRNSIILIDTNGNSAVSKNEDSIREIGEFKKIIELDIYMTEEDLQEMADQVLEQLLITENDIKIKKPITCEDNFLLKNLGDFININYSDCDISILGKKRIIEKNILLENNQHFVQLILSKETFTQSTVNSSILSRMKRINAML